MYENAIDGTWMNADIDPLADLMEAIDSDESVGDIDVFMLSGAVGALYAGEHDKTEIKE